MSTVHLAQDLIEMRRCAVKRMKLLPDDQILVESFHREHEALQDLSGHPGIVTLYDVGKDEQGFYLVLEWVPSNLAEFVARNGRMVWPDFWARVGRPLLDAIVHAQGRGWTHRDIKPANILITEGGETRIADYGIAKRVERPSLGFTFAQFQSAPFTPPEPDDGGASFSRDCFSWAAVAVYCLTAIVPSDYGHLAELADALDVAEVPVDLLGSALSHSPATRPVSASALMADLEAFAATAAKDDASIACHLAVAPDYLGRLVDNFGADDADAVKASILDELREVQAGWRRVDDPAPIPRLRIFAVTLTLEVTVENGRLFVRKAWPSRALEVERHREASFRPDASFTFMAPLDPVASGDAISELLLELDAFETSKREVAAEMRRERIFRLWYAFLRSKADFEAKRENAILFIDRKVQGETVSFTTEAQAPVELLGQSRVVRLGTGGHVFCDVTDLNLDEIVVSVSSGDPGRLPRAGRLEVNTIAAEKSIERQRRALDSVYYDRAPNPRLRALIVDPGSARAPLTVAVPRVDSRAFDDEKVEILRHAIGLQDVLAIEGPPGTGKTRLIEEIVVHYLYRNPKHRVLLSSQTHVALDNVIERINARQAALEIVRVGRTDDAKVSPTCRDLLLDRKAEAWSHGVRSRAKGYITDWASDRGISRSHIELGMVAERLILLKGQVRELRRGLREADERMRDVEERTERKLSDTGSADSAELESDAVEAEQAVGEARSTLDRLRSEIAALESRLRGAGTFGVELADGSEEDLRVWSEVLLGSGPDERRCRELLEIQEQWMLRVGRSSDFHAAMLASAQIVAGTCIGLAGIRGIEQVTFDLCIVDEASKATATEILVPLARSRKWIVVGDPAQLPPFFEDGSITRLEDYDEQEVRGTLLDRLLERLPQHSKAILRQQHRMVEGIGDLISHVFYKGMLKSPKKKPDVTFPGYLPKPVTWLSTSELPNRRESRRGRSFFNEAECQVVRDALRKVDFVARGRKKVYDVAVIAGYVAQVKAIEDGIRDGLHEWSGLRVRCSTVDSFQGSEAEVCIYSVTRSNEEGRLGFLQARERLNVALSRGRSALVIVGDDEFCRAAEGENPFRRVLDHIDGHQENCERRRA